MSLQDELTNDPLTRGYAGMTNQQAADSLGIVDRDKNLDAITGDEMFQQTDSTQFERLTDSKKAQWLSFCNRGSIDPFATANVNFVQYVFGGGVTVSNLQTTRVVLQSRANELNLGPIGEGAIWDIRNGK